MMLWYHLFAHFDPRGAEEVTILSLSVFMVLSACKFTIIWFFFLKYFDDLVVMDRYMTKSFGFESWILLFLT